MQYPARRYAAGKVVPRGCQATKTHQHKTPAKFFGLTSRWDDATPCAPLRCRKSCSKRPPSNKNRQRKILRKFWSLISSWDATPCAPLRCRRSCSKRRPIKKTRQRETPAKFLVLISSWDATPCVPLRCRKSCSKRPPSKS